jgi:hypothetical protein
MDYLMDIIARPRVNTAVMGVALALWASAMYAIWTI